MSALVLTMLERVRFVVFRRSIHSLRSAVSACAASALVMIALARLPAAAESLASDAQAQAPALINVCGSLNPSFTTDDLSGMNSPCAVAPGSVLVEMLYFQNASRIGGTALAAYPLFRIRTGIVQHLEAVVDTPSQIAESGLHGIGLYPTTRLGFGLNDTLVSTGQFAASVGAEAVPPSSRFSTTETQSRFVLDFTVGYRVGRRATVSAIATGTSSQAAGFARVTPAAAFRFAYDASARTQISTDLGSRLLARKSVAQSYGDVAVNQRLKKFMTYSVGLGTTFNPVGNAKAHYLASGFNFRIR